MAKAQKIASMSSVEDEKLRQATAAAIASARKIIDGEGVIPHGTPVGKLSDIELGWLISAGIASWISKRSEQSCTDGFNLRKSEDAIRNTGSAPSPWDTGAIATILPKVAEIPGIDWSMPFGEWPRETIIKFLWASHHMVTWAYAMRDTGDGLIQMPEMPLNDAIPF